MRISYKKQTLFFLILSFLLFSLIELFSILYLDQNNSCYTGLLESGIYSENGIDLKKLCNDYKSILTINYPIKYNIPNQHTETVNINSHGMRGPEFNFDKEFDEYRIFFLGGSTAYGVYSTSDSTTIPGFLDKKLSQEKHNVNVINSGVNGGNSYDEYYLVKNTILKYNPDMLIVYAGWNDLIRQPVDEYPEKNFSYYLSLSNVYFNTYLKFPQLFSLVERVYLKQIFGDNGIPSDKFDPSLSKMKINLWQERWNDICNLGNKEGFKTVIILQPLLGTGEKILHPWEKNTFEKYEHESVIESYEYMINSLEQLNDNCSKVIDFSNIFKSNSELIFYDLGHMGDHGNEIVATKIYDEIILLL